MTNNSSSHLGLVYAGSSWLHRTNENGICKYCGRLSEEIKVGYYPCHRDYGMGDSFSDTQYCVAARHPLFLDVIMEIRRCGYCQNKRYGLCKRHQALEQFLESDSKYTDIQKGDNV